MSRSLKAVLSVLILSLAVAGTANALTIDRSFGENGWLMSELDTSWPRVEAERNGGLLTSTYADSTWESLRRIGADGNPDRGFGRKGATDAGLRAGAQYWDNGAVGDIVTQADGKILVAGALTELDDESDTKYRPYVARYLPDGRVDDGFGEKGFYTPTRPMDFQRMGTFTSVTVRRDGNVLMAGALDDAATVTMLNPRGRPMRGFGKKGTFRIEPRKYDEYAVSEFADLKLAGRGTMVVAGTVGDRPVVVKLDRRGEPVKGFGGDGIVWLSKDGSGGCDSAVDGCEAGARIVRRRNRIYVLTSAYIPAGKRARNLISLKPDGTRDKGFERRAIRSTTPTPRGDYGEFTDMVMKDGRLVLSGIRQFEGEEENSPVILVINRRGNLVKTDGHRIFKLPVDRINTITDICLDRAGRLIVVGFDTVRVDLENDPEYDWYDAQYLRIARFR